MAVIRTEARLDSTQYQKGMRRMKQENKTFQSSVDRTTAKLKKLATFGGLIGGAALAVKAMVDLNRKARDTASTISDMAYQAGLTTTEFQALGAAWREAGKSEDDLLRLTVKLRDSQQQALSSFAEGTTDETLDAFEALGLSAEQLAQKNVPQLLATIAKRLKEAGGAGKEYSAAVDVMGRSFGRSIEAMDMLANEGMEGLIRRKRQEIFSAGVVAQLDKEADRIESMKRRGLVFSTSPRVPFTEDVAAEAAQMELQEQQRQAQMKLIQGARDRLENERLISEEMERQKNAAKEQVRELQDVTAGASNIIRASSAASLGGTASGSAMVAQVRTQIGLLNAQLNYNTAVYDEVTFEKDGGKGVVELVEAYDSGQDPRDVAVWELDSMEIWVPLLEAEFFQGASGLFIDDVLEIEARLAKGETWSEDDADPDAKEWSSRYYGLRSNGVDGFSREVPIIRKTWIATRRSDVVGLDYSDVGEVVSIAEIDPPRSVLGNIQELPRRTYVNDGDPDNYSLSAAGWEWLNRMPRVISIRDGRQWQVTQEWWGLWQWSKVLYGKLASWDPKAS